MKMKKLFPVAIAIMMAIPMVGMAAPKLASPVTVRQARAQAQQRDQGVKGFRMAEENTRQSNRLQEQIDALKATCARQRKLTGTSHKLTRQRAQRRKVQLRQLRKQLAKKRVEKAHICASFPTAEERKMCLGIRVSKAKAFTASEKAESVLLTSIVDGRICKMHPKIVVGGDAGGTTTVHEWKCQPLPTETDVDYTSITRKGVVIYRKTAKYAPRAKSPVVTNPNGNRYPRDAMGVPTNGLPQYRRAAPSTTKVDVKVTNAGLSKVQRCLLISGGAALLGGSAGAGYGWYTGVRGNLHHFADGAPALFTPGTKGDMAFKYGAYSFAGTGVITFAACMAMS